MNKSQGAAVIIIVCGTLLILCAACSFLASDYFSYYFAWLDKFIPR